jgi:tRNA pseudouridine32 synthase/23S rRNA pseudouridine746 synthase/23S rRNA pseudouridine1911/1915/1917 synthase
VSKLNLNDRILYRDQLIIIIDKPAGIPVHAGPSGGESLEDYFEELRFDYKEMPRLAHRLDRDTSGCLVLGRNDRALRKMGRLFESGRIDKTYWAVTDQPPPQQSGLIDIPLRKVKLPKGWSMQPAGINDPDAQVAQTEYKILESKVDGTTLIELHPLTGRTHQIRVHLQALDCPIRGDWLYGPAPERPETFDRLCLHARRIEIPLYEDKPPVVAEAPAPLIMTL